jgi:Helix-loop-helix DNA-binding domain
MPTPILPLTPSASTDISAQDKQWQPSHEPSLTLPPPALQGTAEHSPISPIITHSTNHLDSTNGQHPNRTISTGIKRPRVLPDAKPFTLPSPPTRTRKIIQMKPPRPQPEQQFLNKRRKTTSTPALAATLGSTITPSSKPSSAQTLSKPTKKAIRKTAHSLIERRRRSKMNDAFSTLKDMIPACSGGDDEGGKEMHKLDILNAGIEYLGYLERCLARVNERQWGATGGDLEEEGAEEEVEGGSVSTLGQKNRHDEEPQASEQHHWRPPHGEGKEPFLQACHCRCPCHHTNNAHDNNTLPPSPPPSLEPRPQEHTSAQLLTYETRHADADRDREETKNTAAALLMLTSTDRRRGKTSTSITTMTSSTASHNHPASSIHHQYPFTNLAESNRSPPQYHHHREYDNDLEQEHETQYHATSRSRLTTTPTTPIKAGLSVRDLLLTN